ncbi:MAG: hypothetical protein ACLP75_05305 [Mycobacterium sp.]|uniref:hypothetical protein n=1 Tax=Mycobacterium sp. TaxID=1785 RepID=UPI003F946A45
MSRKELKRSSATRGAVEVGGGATGDDVGAAEVGADVAGEVAGAFDGDEQPAMATTPAVTTAANPTPR